MLFSPPTRGATHDMQARRAGTDAQPRQEVTEGHRAACSMQQRATQVRRGRKGRCRRRAQQRGAVFCAGESHRRQAPVP